MTACLATRNTRERAPCRPLASFQIFFVTLSAPFPRLTRANSLYPHLDLTETQHALEIFANISRVQLEVTPKFERLRLVLILVRMWLLTSMLVLKRGCR